MGRWFFQSAKQLKMTAKVIGADPVGTLFTGLIAGEPDARYPERMCHRAEALARNLVR